MSDQAFIKLFEKQIGFEISEIPVERFATSTADGYSLDPEGYIVNFSIHLNTLYLAEERTLQSLTRLAHLRLMGSGTETIHSLQALKGLTALTVSNVTIGSPGLLEEMKSVHTLELIHVKLQRFDPVTKLTCVKRLNLTDTIIGQPELLNRMTQLVELFVSNTGIASVDFLEHLPHIERLDLSNNPISDITPITKLKKLRSLVLDSLKLPSIEFLGELKSLTELTLSKSPLKDFSIITQLPLLEVLSLEETKIEDASILQHCQRITHLSLKKSNIQNVDFVRYLPFVQKLDLSYNLIETISLDDINPGLESINLEGNFLTTLVFPDNLQQLTSINLSKNKLEVVKLPSVLEELYSIDLSNNVLSEWPDLSTTKMLHAANLSNNNIGSITIASPGKHVKHLDLSSNKISDLTFCENLLDLRSLDLRNNEISAVPESLTRHRLTIDVMHNAVLANHITLKGNPISSPPLEILAKGREHTATFYRQIREQGEEVLYEGKILIVGEGGSGKTTLFKKLQAPDILLPDTDSTLGVEIKEGQRFSHPELSDIAINANLWDFGGQEIQYQLHQYFITRDSLYILVADNRKQHTRWDYWFQIIRLLGGKCHVLVVINNNKTISSTSNFPREDCKNNFKELTIEDINIDFSVNDHHWKFLQDKVRENLSNLPLVNKRVPRKWKLLRISFEELRKTKNYIPINEFMDLCRSVNINEESFMLQALGYFHAIGIILHFEMDPNLRDIIFLNPNWITTALYSALSKSNSEIKNGCFTKEWIEQYWENHENRYTYEDRTYLLRLMLKDNFDICYPIGKKMFMVPMLLPNKTPPYHFDYRNNLHFRFQYPFMPEGIVSRLIVRLHDNILDGLVWQKGAIFVDALSDSMAEITQTYDSETGLKYVGIRVAGSVLNAKKEFLHKIRTEIDIIHRTSFEEMRYSEMVVCNCHKCLTLEIPNFYSLESLRNLINMKVMDKQCTNSGRNIPISDLVGAVYPSKEVKDKLIGDERKRINMEAVAQPKDNKSKGTMLALAVLGGSLVLIVATALILFFNNIPIYWFVCILIFELLVIPAIWSYAVSPDKISEKGAIRMFDLVFRKLNLLGNFLSRVTK